MPVQYLFDIHLVFGYVAWLFVFGAYIWPRLQAADAVAAQRAIATLHSFRFFGLVFLVPGFVEPGLPVAFAGFAAWWDFATAVLALAALAASRVRPLFWALVVAYNLVGAVDLVLDYAHAMQTGVAAQPGLMGAAYAIPVLYVPILMITHIASLWLLARRRPLAAPGAARTAIS